MEEENLLEPSDYRVLVSSLRPALVQVSGGEPLLRKDVIDLVKVIKRNPNGLPHVILVHCKIYFDKYTVLCYHLLQKLKEIIMGKKKYVVKLSQKQQRKLRRLTCKGEAKARQLTRARVLLLADENRKKGVKSDEQISDILDVSLSTIHRIRRQFATEGFHVALEEKPRSGRPKHFSAKDAAKITALACTDPPSGHAKWSMRLIADKAVQLEYVDSISHQTVFNILKKTNFLLTSKSSGVSVR